MRTTLNQDYLGLIKMGLQANLDCPYDGHKGGTIGFYFWHTTQYYCWNWWSTRPKEVVRALDEVSRQQLESPNGVDEAAAVAVTAAMASEGGLTTEAQLAHAELLCRYLWGACERCVGKSEPYDKEADGLLRRAELVEAKLKEIRCAELMKARPKRPVTDDAEDSHPDPTPRSLGVDPGSEPLLLATLTAALELDDCSLNDYRSMINLFRDFSRPQAQAPIFTGYGHPRMYSTGDTPSDLFKLLDRMRKHPEAFVAHLFQRPALQDAKIYVLEKQRQLYSAIAESMQAKLTQQRAEAEEALCRLDKCRLINLQNTSYKKYEDNIVVIQELPTAPNIKYTVTFEHDGKKFSMKIPSKYLILTERPDVDADNEGFNYQRSIK